MSNSRKYKKKSKIKSKRKAGSRNNIEKLIVRNKRQNDEHLRRIYPQFPLDNNNLPLLQDNAPEHIYFPPPPPPDNAPRIRRQPARRNLILEGNADGKKKLKKTKKFRK